MEDSSGLDAFFAKKDKKKAGRNIPKYATSELLVKKLEETGKPQERTTLKKEKKDPNTNSMSGGNPLLEQDDEEWREFEDENEKDYSGLKIQSLNIGDRDKDEDGGKDQNSDENGEESKQAEGQSGPWKIVNPAQMSPEVEVAEPPKGEGEPAVAAAKSSVYVPPQKRQSAQSAVSSNPGLKRKNKAAPEISSELHFPSLSAAAENPKAVPSDAIFQGARPGREMAPLEFENKYQALQQDD